MKNKKIIIPIIMIILILIIGLFIFISKDDSDNSKFNNDYNVQVPKGTSIVYLKDNNLITAFDTEDKLVFLGDSSSKKTKKAVLMLLKVAKDNGIDKIYYYDLNNIDEKTELKNKLLEKMSQKKLESPTLFLIKDKKVEDIQIGISKDTEIRYEDIMIGYIMCNNPDC